MMHTNRVYGTTIGIESRNRIRQHLPPKPRGVVAECGDWVMRILFGDTSKHSEDCLCEPCRRDWVLKQIEFFDGDYCRDCLLPGPKCRCQPADA
jgi:hypothetical protein